MKAVWAAVGAVMGAGVGMKCGGFSGAIVLMTACVFEFATLGAIFALIGGRPNETILGAVGGLLGGLTVGMMGGQASVVLLANVGLLVGAVVGSTLHACLRVFSLPITLLEQMLRRHQRPTVIAMGPDGLNGHQPFLPATSTLYAGTHPVGVRSSLRHESVVFPRAEVVPSHD
jgi:hypothetical protein